jgi:hypothetical protein
MLKRVRAKLFLALFLFIGIERFCHFQTEGFALSKMLLENSPPSAGPSETLTFIGAGKQFYAFETADRKYVVKFMKFSRRRPLPWLEKIPLSFLESWKRNYLAERAKRLSNLESSSRLALEQLSSEAALASYPLSKHLILIDKLGIRHRIDRAQTKFLVQKKATAFILYFEQNPSQAQALISSYIETISSQCKKGISNLDPILERNYGVVDNRMILMDVGSLLASPKLSTSIGLKRQIFLELLPLRQWLQNHHPEHLAYFDLQLKKNRL